MRKMDSSREWRLIEKAWNRHPTSLLREVVIAMCDFVHSYGSEHNHNFLIL